MKIIRFLFRRPVVLLTAVCILSLVIIDRAGYFSRPPKGDPAYFASAEQVLVEGTVLSPPQAKNTRFLAEIGVTRVNNSEARGTLLLTYGNPGGKLATGDTVRFKARIRRPQAGKNPGVFDYSSYLARRGIYATASVKQLERTGHKDPNFLYRAALALSSDISAKIRASLPEREADVLAKMLIGGNSAISREDRDKFSNAGVMHILVVSGLNVAYIAAFFWFIFRLAGIPHNLTGLMTLPFILLYVLATGGNPPVVRAGVMAAFVILSLALARAPEIPQSLCLAALAILAVNPQALFTPSFQLSFAATLGIVFLYKPLMAPFSGLPTAARWLLATAAVTVAAQLAVSPLLAYYFNKLSVIGLLSNIVIVPLAGVITITGLALYLSFYALPFASPLAAEVNYRLVHLVLALVDRFSAFKFSTVSVPSPSFTALAAYYSAILAVLAWPVMKRAARISAVAAVCVLTAAAFYTEMPAGKVFVTFLDVGESDCAHIAFPDGSNWLIDCGSGVYEGFDAGERIISPYLISKGISEIDNIVITHPHFEHFSGAAAVLKAFKVNEVSLNEDISGEREFTELLALAKEKDIPVRRLKAGGRFVLGGAEISVLSPSALSDSAEDNSLVLLLKRGAQGILFTGDIGREAENRAAAALKGAEITAVQLPRHGKSKDSSRLLSVLRPEYAIISSRAEVNPVRNGSWRGKFLSTGRDGAVTIELSGDEARVITHLSRERN